MKCFGEPFSSRDDLPPHYQAGKGVADCHAAVKLDTVERGYW